MKFISAALLICVAILLLAAGTHIVAGWIQAGNINSTLYVDGINYANISACIAALPSNGGTCVLPPNYTETLNSALLLGNGSTQSVILNAPNGARLTCAMTATECIGLYNQSGLIGGGGMWSIGSNPNRQNAFVIVDNGSMSVTNMIQNMTTPQASVTFDRVWVEKLNGGTVSGACVDWEGLGNGIIFRDSLVNCPGSTGWQILGNGGFTGPMTVQNVWGQGDGTGNSLPCKIGNSVGSPQSVVSIRVVDGVCNWPGPGLPALAIDGTNSGSTCQIRGIDISTHVELYTGPINTVGILVKNACDVDIHGMAVASSGAGPGGAGTGINIVSINQTGAGLTRAVVINALNAFQPSGGNCINNVITGQTFNSGCNFSGYTYVGDSALTPVIFENGGSYLFQDAAGNGPLTFNGTNANSDLNWFIQGNISTNKPLIAAGSAAALTGTGACATGSLSTQKGGSWGGQVTCATTTGASTLVVSPGTTATNGMGCSGNDTTSGHELAGAQSGVSTTTCTLKFSSVTNGDVIDFNVWQY